MGVIVPDAHLPLVQVEPQRPGTRAKAKRANDSGLRSVHEVGFREERVDPVGRPLVLTYDLDLFIQEKRTPLLANAHGRVNRTTMDLIHPAHTVFIPIVEVPTRRHPVIPRTYPRLHVIQRKNKPQPTQILLHMLGHPILIQAISTHVRISIHLPIRSSEASAPVTTSPVP